MTYDQMVAECRLLSDKELNELAQGCTELMCLYHGPINEVRRERGIR